MKVKYLELNIEKETESDILFLKNNDVWLILSQEKRSRYFGGFILKDGQAFRFLDNIEFGEKIKNIIILNPNEIIIEFWHNHCYLKLEEKSIHLIFSYWTNVKLNLDSKYIFNNNAFARNIIVETPKVNHIFVKQYFNDQLINQLLIETDSNVQIKKQWVKQDMNFDKKRNSYPYEWWTYECFEGKIRELKINLLPNDSQDFNPNEKTDHQNSIFILNHNPSHQNQSPLNNFLVKRIMLFETNQYFAAGFPWFYEHWYRDELLSLYLLKENIDKNIYKQKLNFYLNNLETIWDKNKPVNSQYQQWQWDGADTLLLFIATAEQKLLENNAERIIACFKLWQKKFMKNNVIHLPSYSTWMDTLNRQEAIEIESLYVNALNKLISLKNIDELVKIRLKAELEVRENELKKKIINRDNDPNIIFAFLFTKYILPQETWTQVFDKLLKNNYLLWGGLATLNTDNPHFQNEDDGEKNSAYHRGNSWYFLNNLLGISLCEINIIKYKEIIEKIYLSSLDDLLKDGALGFSSEISSAKERRSEGTIAQLWSMASFNSFSLKFEYPFQNEKQ